MKTRITLLTVLVGVTAAFLFGCLGDISEPTHGNPADPDNPGTNSVDPARPSGLAAVVSDRLIAMAWGVSDTTGIDEYIVYRWEVQSGEAEEYDEIASVDEMEYDDAQVRNGVEYSYKVSAVNRHGLEGAMSYPMSATPRIFSVAINPSSKADTAKMGTTLTRMCEEDPTLKWRQDPTTGETILSGMGDAYLPCRGLPSDHCPVYQPA